jgi:ATP-dependent DNA helicase RecG
MNPSLGKLQKFFKLEAERGYDNRAVLGGLERMLSPWEAEARLDGLPEELISAVVTRLRDYHRLSSTSRQEALQGLWRRLQRGTGTELPDDDLGEPPVFEKVEEAEDIAALGLVAELHLEEIPPTEPPPAADRSPLPMRLEATASRPVASFLEALNAPVTVLQSVGPRHGETLKRLGLETLGDMLYYFPRRYDDYSLLKPINRLEYGEQVTVIASVESVTTRPLRNGHTSITEAVVNDGSGHLRLTWFNQPWVARRLRPGVLVVLSGRIDQYLGRLTITNPEVEQLEHQNLHTNRIVPVYPLTANITQRWLRRLMHQVVTHWAPQLPDPLTQELRSAENLVELSEALLQSHFPESQEKLEAARNRLAFDEILFVQLGMLRQKQAWRDRSARVFETPQEWLEGQVARLPFELTSAQQRALEDVRLDLAGGHPMNRLLQGDVGSGKTAIAAMAIAMVVKDGSQAAMMAPTSILAEQHFSSLRGMLSGEGGLLANPQIRLMIGATPEAEKLAIREGLAAGEIKVIVGTHALIEEPVIMADLQLGIIDEQHRFGVEQRALLRSKGENPHLLVMTATPIPRSLALTVYGDLDLLILDELPPGRQPVSTHVLLPRERERAYALIRKQIAQGYQAFIIYPLVEETGSTDGEEAAGGESKAAVEEHHRLQKDIFPQHRLGLLHGRLRPEEKEQVMTRFRDGEAEILVSTSVVEVGVDIPNATVMLVEGANRFGLAQLHQFRGRVGRGEARSYCLLIPETEDSVENERLAAMVETNDGFILAELDLKQRGPGNFLGTRQSGFTRQLRLASITDVHLIERAQRAAKQLFERDPHLALPEHRLLASTLAASWGEDGPGPQGDVS